MSSEPIIGFMAECNGACNEGLPDEEQKEPQVTDPVVASVIQKLIDRSKRGIEEYGVGLDRPDYTAVDFLVELQNELLDGANYIEAILFKLRQSGSREVQGRDIRRPLSHPAKQYFSDYLKMMLGVDVEERYETPPSTPDYPRSS